MRKVVLVSVSWRPRDKNSPCPIKGLCTARFDHSHPMDHPS